MKNFKTAVILVTIMLFITSCFFNKKPKDVDSFYTKKIYLDFPVLPLSKPIFICYNKSYKEWSYKIPYFFKNRMQPSDPKEVGIDSIYVYGRKKEEIWNLYEDYEKGEYVYARKYSGISRLKKPLKTNEKIQIFSIDTVKNTFVEPERWFVINVADSTTEAFFSKKKYQNYLKEKGISGKMYNINKYHKQYKETGILPWFPDNINEKLKK